MSLPQKIIKRSFNEVDYSRKKIKIAISKALNAVQDEIKNSPTFLEITHLDQSSDIEQPTIDDKAEHVTSLVEKDLIKLKLKTVNIEQIQDLVEKNLMGARLFSTAKSYILYREHRNKLREVESKEDLQKLVDESMKTFDDNIARMFTYMRTYSRWIEEKGRRETWIETVDRYMNFMRNKVKDLLTEEEYNEVREYILQQKVMPSMRLLQFAGPAAERCNVCAYNCAYTAISSIKKLKDAMYISLSGTGFGFSVEYDQSFPLFNEDGTPVLDENGNQVIKVIPIVDNFPAVKPPSGETFHHVIGDSKEGWADAFGFGLEKWFNGDKVKFDYSKIRPKDAPMKTMGGRASGPEALKRFLMFVKYVIRRRVGAKLLSVDFHDIICRMAIDTSEGGLRRAALISLSELDDNELRIAKIGRSLWSNGQRFKSNNSVAYTRKPTKEQFDKEWQSLVDSKNGERGIFNRGDLKNVLPKRRVDVIGDLIHQLGTNPCCVTADTWIQTVEGPRQVSDLIGKKVDVIVNGKSYNMISNGFFSTGKQLIYELKTKQGYSIKLTGDHQVMQYLLDKDESFKHLNGKGVYQWVPVNQLRINDKISISNHSSDQMVDITIPSTNITISVPSTNITWKGKGTFEEGWLIGYTMQDGLVIDNKIVFRNVKPETINKYVDITNKCYEKSFKSTINHEEETIESETLYELCKNYNMNKINLSNEIEKTSSEFHHGFLNGFFEGAMIHKHLGRLYARLPKLNFFKPLQRMLLRFGIVSSLDTWDGRNFSIFIRKCNVLTRYLGEYFFEGVSTLPSKLIEKFSKRKEFYIDEIESIRIKCDKNGEECVEEVYDVDVEDVHEFCANGIRAHNCEIILTPNEFCNLSEVICRFNDTLETLLKKIRIATIIGTYQSMLTDFQYIDPEWKQNQELERLLGVSLTGIYDCPMFFTEESYKNRTFIGNGEVFKRLREYAVEINQIYAKRFNINPSTAVTTGKPSGTVSQVADTSNGGHPRYAPYYIRRIRIAANDPLFQLMKAEGYTYAPEVGQKEETATVFVIDFPTKAPEGSIFVKDVTSIQQLEFWKVIKTQYTEHNPSVSIYYREHETEEIKEWIWNNWEYITGLSFFPLDENVYELAVYEEITEEQYYELSSKIKKVNFANLVHYEKSDTTDVAKEAACVGGKCDL